MTTTLHLPARPGAAIACDMSHAADTPDERMREYDRLFAGALLGRERRDAAVVLTFGGGHETRTWVEDLARREAACCPFADYKVEADGDRVTWTITNPVTGDERASVDLVLDAYYAMPDHPGLDLSGLLDAC
jgi:hypothetical protein